MTVFNSEEVKKCLEDVVGEDKEYALWLLEWAINKRSYDLEEYREQVIEECADLFSNILSNMPNVCGINCPVKCCSWGTEESCKDMCKKWFLEQLIDKNA